MREQFFESAAEYFGVAFGCVEHIVADVGEVDVPGEVNMKRFHDELIGEDFRCRI